MFLVLEKVFTKRLKIILQSNYFFVFLFLILCFYVFFFTKVVHYSSEISENTTKISAKLLSFSIDGDKLSMLLKDKEKISATYYIQSKEEKEYLEKNLKIGLEICLFGKKSEIRENTIPNIFNYKEYLYHERIYFVFSVSKIELLENQIDLFSNLKNFFDARLKRLGDNAYLKAFILGDKTLLDADVYKSIVSNGVSHLFALSGMHLSLVYFLLSKLLFKLKFKKIFIYLFLFFYLFLTGFSVSFLRAILFMLFLAINKKFEFHLSSIKVLFFTACLLLFYEPFYVFNVGFWYTFVVTFSLLYCYDLLKNKKKVMQTILVSVITFLFSLPITIFINYEINLLSILNNLFFVPFISIFVFPAALVTFLFPFFFPIFQGLVSILEGMNAFSYHFAIPLIVGKITLWEMFLYYVFLVFGIKCKQKKYFVFLILWLFLMYNKNIFVPYYSVYFLDVGQGDATLFVAPRGKEAILIDTGGKVSFGEKKEFQIRNKESNLADNLVTFFKSIRVRHIDLLLITHGDQDHLGYAEDIGKKIRYQKVMLNLGDVNSLENNIKNKYPIVEDYVSKYFSYKTYTTKIYNNENDNSLVTNWCIGPYCFLMMGDASLEVEKNILSKYDVSATFLKVGHHGSKTSSSKEFIAAVHPKYSIISVGKNNRYGHPNSETLENLKSTTIYRTDKDGTILVKIKKNKLKIETYAP